MTRTYDFFRKTYLPFYSIAAPHQTVSARFVFPEDKMAILGQDGKELVVERAAFTAKYRASSSEYRLWAAVWQAVYHCQNWKFGRGYAAVSLLGVDVGPEACVPLQEYLRSLGFPVESVMLADGWGSRGRVSSHDSSGPSLHESIFEFRIRLAA